MIRATAILVRHSLRRMRVLLMVMAVALAAFQVLFASAAGALQRQGMFSQLANIVPAFARELIGTALVAMMSFSGILALGYYHPVVIAALVGLVIAIGTEPAAEIEAGFADLMLSRPIARGAILARSVVMLVAGPTLVIGLMVAGSRLALTWAAPPGELRSTQDMIWSLAVSLYALAFCWSGVALAVASAARRRGVAGSIVSGLAASSMLVDYLSRVWSPLKPVALYSPFHYYNPLNTVIGQPLSFADLCVLGAVGVVGIVIAWTVFTRRDV